LASAAGMTFGMINTLWLFCLFCFACFVVSVVDVFVMLVNQIEFQQMTGQIHQIPISQEMMVSQGRIFSNLCSHLHRLIKLTL